MHYLVLKEICAFCLGMFPPFKNAAPTGLLQVYKCYKIDRQPSEMIFFLNENVRPCYRMKIRSWEDASVRKMLTVKAQGLEF